MFTRFRDWLKQQTPLDQPDLAEIIIKSVINDFGTVDETVSVSLPILTSTSISSDLALSNLQLCPDDLGEVQLIDSIIDNYYECLIEPIIKEESFSKLDFIS